MNQVKKERRERLKERLQEYYRAEERVLLGQEYSIGTRTLRRADLAEIRKAIKDLENQISLIDNAGKNKAARFIPRDI